MKKKIYCWSTSWWDHHDGWWDRQGLVGPIDCGKEASDDALTL
jgi:hypothetical protein